MAHSYRLVPVTWRYQVRIPVSMVTPDICHRGYMIYHLYSAPNCFLKAWSSLQSAAYGTVHYKEYLKLFEIRVGHSPVFGLPSVAILP